MLLVSAFLRSPWAPTLGKSLTQVERAASTSSWLSDVSASDVTKDFRLAANPPLGIDAIPGVTPKIHEARPNDRIGISLSQAGPTS